MKVVGLTGGIGSGKTTVANFFKSLGAPVFIADIEAKKIMENSQDVKSKIEAHFGSSAYSGNLPNRKYLANVVFKDEEKLNILNGIIHPAVAERFQEWKAQQNFTYIIYEAAILFEKGNYKSCDYIIVVTAPKPERIKRIQQRDQASIEEIEERMSKQWSDEQKIKLASFVIENVNLEVTKAKVKKIHQFLIESR